MKNRFIDTSLDFKRTSRYLLRRIESEELLCHSTIENIKGCGEGVIAFICKNNPKHPIMHIKKRCNWKYCPDCMGKYGKKQMFKVRKIINSFSSCRLVTLAFKNIRKLTREIVDLYLDQFYALIRLLKARGYITAYCRVIHIKKIGLTWNFHIHIVFDGRYIPQKELVSLFKRVTKGESYIVDIRRIGRYNNTKGYVANYLSRYLIKMPLIKPMEYYYDFYLSFKNKRMFQSSLRIAIPKSRACCPVCKGELEVFMLADGGSWPLFEQAWRDYYIKDDNT